MVTGIQIETIRTNPSRYKDNVTIQHMYRQLYFAVRSKRSDKNERHSEMVYVSKVYIHVLEFVGNYQRQPSAYMRHLSQSQCESSSSPIVTSRPGIVTNVLPCANSTFVNTAR